MLLHLLGATPNLLVSTKMESLLLRGSSSDKLLIGCRSRRRCGIPSHRGWEFTFPPSVLLQCVHVNRFSTSELRPPRRKMRCRRWFLQCNKTASIVQENGEVKLWIFTACESQIDVLLASFYDDLQYRPHRTKGRNGNGEIRITVYITL